MTGTSDDTSRYAFRKKPVVIAAVQFSDRISEIDGPEPDWYTAARTIDRGEVGSITYADRTLRIMTLEGEMTARPGDWIIKGIKGELYPCKPDIFAATYEAAGAVRAITCPALGDTIKFLDTYRYAADWRGEFTVIGIRFDDMGLLDITIADGKNRRGEWESPTDGFRPEDMIVVKSAALLSPQDGTGSPETEIERHLWAAIDLMAATLAKPDAKIWSHLLVYAPKGNSEPTTAMAVSSATCVGCGEPQSVCDCEVADFENK